MPRTACSTDTGNGKSDTGAPWPTGQGIGVLLVDPDSASRHLHRRILEDAGFRVEQAGDLVDVPRVIEERRPDVIVLDVSALHEQGRAAWINHLEASPASRDLSIVLLASPGIELDTLAELEARIDACIIKPVESPELLTRVQAAARSRQRRLGQTGLRELRGEQARMWSVLIDFSRSMGRTTVLDEVLDRLVMTAAEMTCSRRVSLMLPDDRQEFLHVARAIGFDEELTTNVRLPVGKAIAGQAFASGRRRTSIIHGDRAGRGGAYDGSSFVSMPIKAATRSFVDRSVGVLNMTDRFGDRPFQEWELEFIDLLGGIAGTAIDDTLWRKARESLLKYECDLQVARRIQRSTFPARFPTLPGFDVSAWNEPAEATGGDIYDVIGYRNDPGTGAVALSPVEAERAVLLLADATGHGIGPALSVTQVRAMLRMAVRLEPALARIVTNMNEQLCADLPRGRFITAWLGMIDAAAHTLTCFSAGQGPVLHHVAERDTVERLQADTLPLGIVPDLQIDVGPPLKMAPGDIVAVISDGIFEAADEGGLVFGTDRAVDVIRRYRFESAEEILTALRTAVAEFVGDAPASDDRTVLIVKRTAD